ncbi:MAG: sigma-70 family RNA polymerase sigma factor [Firmicutes bacterium]|nr:sigma-70 family RNA polymerase sigma factor [Bacillota bacterium]
MRDNKKDSAVRELVSNNYTKYYKLAYSYVKNDQDAMDVLQESVYKAILKSAQIRDLQYADTWICRIIINEAMNYFRKKNDYISLDECITCAVSSGTGDMDLDRALKSVKKKDRDIIRMKYEEGYTIKEIAEKINENENTVKSRLYRSLARIKEVY